MRILTAIANNSLFAIRNYDCNLQPTKDICRHHFAHVIDRQNLFLWMAIRSHYFPGLANRNSVGTTTVVHFPRVTIVFRVYVIRRVQHFWIPPKHQQQRPSTFFYKLNYVCGLFVSEQFQVKRNNIH